MWAGMGHDIHIPPTRHAIPTPAACAPMTPRRTGARSRVCSVSPSGAPNTGPTLQDSYFHWCARAPGSLGVDPSRLVVQVERTTHSSPRGSTLTTWSNSIARVGTHGSTLGDLRHRCPRKLRSFEVQLNVLTNPRLHPALEPARHVDEAHVENVSQGRCAHETRIGLLRRIQLFATSSAPSSTQPIAPERRWLPRARDAGPAD
jgi:hypothetical protein